MTTPQPALRRIDMHCHVGVLGDEPEYARYGRISPWMRRQATFQIFLAYARIPQHRLSDRALEEAVIGAVTGCGLDGVVCLALDPVYDEQGRRREESSHLWVDNDYILRLRAAAGDRVLFGASVHPYDPAFQERVRRCVANGAVLLKWLPSAQQIDLADERVGRALEFLATPLPDATGAPRILPLLLHVGAEYAIESTSPHSKGFDFLSWTWRDELANRLRRRRKWQRPNVAGALANLRAARDAGARIILAHCGLPYFASGPLSRVFEHSDLGIVSTLLGENGNGGRGRFYADVSACCTPFRRRYFDKLAKLPESALLFGSDFPVPVFDLGHREFGAEFEAVLRGDFDRVLIPDDNLLDVNERVLRRFFPGHPLFTNFAQLLASS